MQPSDVVRQLVEQTAALVMAKLQQTSPGNGPAFQANTINGAATVNQTSITNNIQVMQTITITPWDGGRCISVDHRVHHATKEIPPSMATGEAAGTAAALAVRRGLALADLPIDVLRDELRTAGAIVDPPAQSRDDSQERPS